MTFSLEKQRGTRGSFHRKSPKPQQFTSNTPRNISTIIRANPNPISRCACWTSSSSYARIPEPMHAWLRGKWGVWNRVFGSFLAFRKSRNAIEIKARDLIGRVFHRACKNRACKNRAFKVNGNAIEKILSLWLAANHMLYIFRLLRVLHFYWTYNP